MVIREELNKIRTMAEETFMYPNKFYEMNDYINNLLKTVDMNDKRDVLFDELSFDISEDALMSFIFATHGNFSHPLVTSIKRNISVDKKWVGPFDLDIFDSMQYINRQDILNRLEKLEMKHIVSYVLGLTNLIHEIGFATNYNSVTEYCNQLQQYMANGTLMDTDYCNGEHYFTPNIFGLDNYVIPIVQTISNYIAKINNELLQSNYNHSDKENREYAITRFINECSYELYKTLDKGRNIRANSTKPSNQPEYYAMLPILDIGLRITLYGFIENDTQGKPTMESVTNQIIEIRRVLENEYMYIEYDQFHGEKYGYQTNYRRYSSKFKYIGNTIEDANM